MYYESQFTKISQSVLIVINGKKSDVYMLEMCSTIRRIQSKILILFQNFRRNLLVRKIARRIKKIIFSMKLFYNHIFHERYSDIYQDRKKRIMIIIFEPCKVKLSLKCEVHPVY